MEILAFRRQTGSIPLRRWTVVVASVLLSLLAPAPSHAAAEPVKVLVSGIPKGEMLDNVHAALSMPEGMISAGKVNLPWLERFAHNAPDRVRKAMEPFGYYNPQVNAGVEQSGGDYLLKIDIHPGPPVIVTRVDISISGAGSGERALAELISSFPLKRGDVLRQDRYESAKGQLKSRAAELGYLAADFPSHKILLSIERSEASIELAFETGQQYFFGEITFEGEGAYPETFLRRYLSFETGQVFSYSKIGATHLNFINSDRFQNVTITARKEDALDFRVPVLVRLEPSLPKRFRIGAGYGTDTGPRVALHYKDLNVFKKGHELDSEIDISQRLKGIAAGYTIPGRKIDSSRGVQFKLLREDVTSYKTSLASVEFDRVQGFGRGMVGTAFLRFQREDSTIGTEKVNARLVLPGFRFVQQRYDNLVRPTRGFRYGIEVLGTEHFLGSDTGFAQIVSEGHLLVPMPLRLSLLTRATAGATFERGSFNNLPATLRFFAGGDRSVRGYSYQSLGPKDSAGNVVGGKDLLVGSLEVERAILQDWGLAVFYDAGNAFDSLTDLTLFQGAGLGIRYYTKVGAIRLDVARQVAVPNPRFHIHFNFGLEL